LDRKNVSRKAATTCLPCFGFGLNLLLALFFFFFFVLLFVWTIVIAPRLHRSPRMRKKRKKVPSLGLGCPLSWRTWKLKKIFLSLRSQQTTWKALRESNKTHNFNSYIYSGNENNRALFPHFFFFFFCNQI
jgi:hypothetical protein